MLTALVSVPRADCRGSVRFARVLVVGEAQIRRPREMLAHRVARLIDVAGLRRLAGSVGDRAVIRRRAVGSAIEAHAPAHAQKWADQIDQAEEQAVAGSVQERVVETDVLVV